MFGPLHHRRPLARTQHRWRRNGLILRYLPRGRWGRGGRCGEAPREGNGWRYGRDGGCGGDGRRGRDDAAQQRAARRGAEHERRRCPGTKRMRWWGVRPNRMHGKVCAIGRVEERVPIVGLPPDVTTVRSVARRSHTLHSAPEHRLQARPLLLATSSKLSPTPRAHSLHGLAASREWHRLLVRPGRSASMQ